MRGQRAAGRAVRRHALIVAPGGEPWVSIVPAAGTVPVMTRWTSQLEAAVLRTVLGLPPSVVRRLAGRPLPRDGQVLEPGDPAAAAPGEADRGAADRLATDPRGTYGDAAPDPVDRRPSADRADRRPRGPDHCRPDARPAVHADRGGRACRHVPGGRACRLVPEEPRDEATVEGRPRGCWSTCTAAGWSTATWTPTTRPAGYWPSGRACGCSHWTTRSRRSTASRPVSTTAGRVTSGPSNRPGAGRRPAAGGRRR